MYFLTTGGSTYTAGVSVAGRNWSMAENGDLRLDVDVAFGKALEEVGVVEYWSFMPRVGTRVSCGDMNKILRVDAGDSVTINAGTIRVPAA